MWIKNNSKFEDHTLILCLYLSASLSLAGTGVTKMSRGRSRWRSRRGKRRLLLIWHLYRNYKRRSRRKSVWVHPIFTKRRDQGEYHNLLQELCTSDPESHFRYVRMSKEGFDYLLEKVFCMGVGLWAFYSFLWNRWLPFSRNDAIIVL